MLWEFNILNWLLFYLTPTDNVAYISDQNESTSYMPYKKFIEYIFKFAIIDGTGMMKEINCFETIFFNISTAEWCIYQQQKKPSTFDELVKFNNQIKEQPNETNVNSVAEQQVKANTTWIENFMSKQKKFNVFGRNSDSFSKFRH